MHVNLGLGESLQTLHLQLGVELRAQVSYHWNTTPISGPLKLRSCTLALDLKS